MAEHIHVQDVLRHLNNLKAEWDRYPYWADKVTLIFVVSTCVAAPIVTGYMLMSMALGNW